MTPEHNTDDAPLDWAGGYQTIGPSELGKLLGRSTKSIQLDAARRPETLPPRFTIPGCRLVRWLKKDVLEWMEVLANIQRDQRKRDAEFAKRFPDKSFVAPRPFNIANKPLARAVNDRLNAMEGL